MDKQQAAYDLNPKSISKDALDSAANAVATAKANLEVACKQRDLTKAGAWIYDINNQEKNLQRSVQIVFVRQRAAGEVHAPRAQRRKGAGHQSHCRQLCLGQGAYDTYTQGMEPVLVLGSPHAHLNVRCYVDEILVPRLPDPSKMKAQMSVRGSNVKIPLRVRPNAAGRSPKIELSDQRLERVDVRVLADHFPVRETQGYESVSGPVGRRVYR